MKAVGIRIHNFRSILDEDIELCPYGLLVGPNGAGKSNVLASIRAFYDDVKFTASMDFPKMATEDQESWVEIQYSLTDEEAGTVKAEYLDSASKTIRVRRYFQTETKDAEGKPCVGGIFAYVAGSVSDSRFYGAKNIQQAKLGKAVYIPAVTKLDDHTKLSGPSSLRELVNFVLRGQLESSKQFETLTQAFGEFRETLRGASGGPLEQLEDSITQEIQDWGHKFSLDVRSLSVDELLKGLVAPKIIDGDLERELEPSQFGHGFQRHLVYSLMMLAARYSNLEKVKPKKKDFDPDLFWVLYEEPEAFLHPPQAEVLNVGLRKFADMSGQQVLVTTHSPHFASKNLAQIPSLIRLSRKDKSTRVGQVRSDRVSALFSDNQDLVEKLKAAGVALGGKDDTVALEGIKYSLWLDPSRAAALFAKRVLLVEGASERALIGYLCDQGKFEIPVGGVAAIDTLGKWNTHRFMNLLGALRIPHAVLFDRDERPGKSEKDRKISKVLNAAIEASRNEFTYAVKDFPSDLEDTLGVNKAEVKTHQKPQYLLHAVAEGEVDPAKLAAFIALVQELLSGTSKSKASAT